MKRAFSYTLLILFFISFHSCNEITADDFVLTDENTPLHNYAYKYWYPLDSKNLKSEDIFVIKSAGENTLKRLWMISPFDKNSKRKETIYLRRNEIATGNFIFQATSWENDKNISLFLGKQLNDTIFQFFAYNEAAMEFGPKSDILRPFNQHIKFKKDAIKFDAVAASEKKKEILEFIASLDNPKYCEEEVIKLVGTNDIDKIKLLLVDNQ